MADKKTNDEVSEAQIAVHWKEEDYFEPTQDFIDQANIKNDGIEERFDIKNFPDCYKEYADMLDWYKPYDKILDSSKPPFYKWFVGGKINRSSFCSRTGERADPAYYIPGALRKSKRVCRIASGFLRIESGRYRYSSHAYDSRAAYSYARLRETGGNSLSGILRLFR